MNVCFCFLKNLLNHQTILFWNEMGILLVLAEHRCYNTTEPSLILQQLQTSFIDIQNSDYCERKRKEFIWHSDSESFFEKLTVWLPVMVRCDLVYNIICVVCKSLIVIHALKVHVFWEGHKNMMKSPNLFWLTLLNNFK